MSELLNAIMKADKKMVIDIKESFVDECIGNCSSCDDVRCLFHNSNYDEEKIVELLKSKLRN